MSDNISVITSTDVIEVIDPTTQVPITITEDVISVGSGTDEIAITVNNDVIDVNESTPVIQVTDEQTVIQPNVGDVHVQVMEDSDVPYAKRTDFEGDSIIYRGEAPVGSDENVAVWRIRRLTIAADDDVAEEWANGDAKFDKVWLDRTSEVYS